MKTSVLNVGLVFWLVVWGSYAAAAQPTPPPIIVHLSEIDRPGISALTPAATNSVLAIPFKSSNKSAIYSNVLMIVRNGTPLNQAVLIIDGEKLIAKGSLIGYCRTGHKVPGTSNNISESGLTLGFESPEEAKREEAILGGTPNIEIVRPVPEPKSVGDWSDPVNGIRGRLLFAERAQYEWEIQRNCRPSDVYLELQNIAAGDSIYVYYNYSKSLRCELQDSGGNVIPLGGVWVWSDGRPAPCWLALPRDSTLRFSTTILVGSPTNSLLISVGEEKVGGAWKIPLDSTNVFHLSGILTFITPTNETRSRVWVGTLKLPPVLISAKSP